MKSNKNLWKGFTAILFAAMMVVTVFAQVYPAGMVSYWKFDEGSGITASDSVGENGGTIYGAIWTTGIVDVALSFDGVDDYVEDTSFVDFDSTYHTILFWVKRRSIGTQEVIFELMSFTGDGHMNTLYFTPDDTLYWNYEDNNVKTDRLESSTTITDSNWHHIVAVHNGPGDMWFYIDDIKDTGHFDYNQGAGDLVFTQLEVARHFSHNAYFFNGTIDEVAIYNRALTPEEIQQHYQNGLQGLGYEVVLATIDIDPDTLNLKSRGKWITCYIELPEGYDVADIDVSTILLEDEIPAEAHPTGIGDYDNDGIADLMVKFDRSVVQGILEVGEEVEITVAGELTDGTPFEGSDTIRVIDKGKGK